MKKIQNLYPVQAKGNEIERTYDIWVFVNGAQQEMDFLVNCCSEMQCCTLCLPSTCILILRLKNKIFDPYKAHPGLLCGLHFCILFTKICVSKNPSLQIRVLTTFWQLLQWHFLNCHWKPNESVDSSKRNFPLVDEI